MPALRESGEALRRWEAETERLRFLRDASEVLVEAGAGEGLAALDHVAEWGLSMWREADVVLGPPVAVTREEEVFRLV